MMGGRCWNQRVSSRPAGGKICQQAAAFVTQATLVACKEQTTSQRVSGYTDKVVKD